FSKEAAGPANILIEAGVKGWRDTNAEIDRNSELQDKINEKISTYNAKLEAVQGTIENLKVTAFTPMLDQIKPALDKANSLIGSLQEWGKEHQTLAKIGVDVFGVGSAALVAAGGIKALIAARGLMKIAMAAGAGESGLLQYLVGVRTNSVAAGVAME